MTFPPTQRTPDEATTGVFRGMPFDKYARLDALNASTISRFLVSSKTGAWYLQGEPDEPSAAMLFGSAMHARILEPDDYKERAMQTELGPGADVGHRKMQDEHPDAIILRAGWSEKIERIAEELYEHPRASAILSEADAHRELTIVWNEQIKYNGKRIDIPCKARLDFFSDALQAVVDIKKVRKDAGIKDAFSKSIWNYGYHIQAAWYARAAQKAGLCSKRPDYAWICVEESPPHEIDLYQADKAMMKLGWKDCKTGLYAYTRYRITGEARGRSNSIEGITLPAWAGRDEE
ncbi:MAG: PD-(D/E)XK nuclease-like domain-containing protein [Phycisphaerales bacterium]